MLSGNEKTNHYNTTIYIDDEIKYYLLKEINYRKDLAMKITLTVKDMQFLFAYWSSILFDMWNAIHHFPYYFHIITYLPIYL